MCGKVDCKPRPTDGCKKGDHTWKTYRSFDGEYWHQDVACKHCGVYYNEGT